MHWNRQASMGFTTGLPWEPLQPDSLSANVEAQASDPASLLSHYRSLIRLRRELAALGSANDLVPLETGGDSVLAYLRRGTASTVLVIANLSDRAINAPKLSSSAAVLKAGDYAVRARLGHADAASLRIGQDGRMRDWQPITSMEPLTAVVLELR
jgi:glycosidase